MTAFDRAYARLRAKSVAPLARHFPAEGLIVDLGCGVGALSLALVEDAPGRRVVAVDHDKDRVAFLSDRAPDRVQVVCSDLGAYEIPPCAAVALVDVLHYFHEGEQDALLLRAAAALEPGGVLVLRDCDVGLGWRFLWNRFHERVATGLGFTQAEIGHYRSAADWAAALERQGLAPTVEPPGRGPYADRVVVGRKP